MDGGGDSSEAHLQFPELRLIRVGRIYHGLCAWYAVMPRSRLMQSNTAGPSFGQLLLSLVGSGGRQLRISTAVDVGYNISAYNGASSRWWILGLMPVFGVAEVGCSFDFAHREELDFSSSGAIRGFCAAALESSNDWCGETPVQSFKALRALSQGDSRHRARGCHAQWSHVSGHT